MEFNVILVGDHRADQPAGRHDPVGPGRESATQAECEPAARERRVGRRGTGRIATPGDGQPAAEATAFPVPGISPERRFRTIAFGTRRRAFWRAAMRMMRTMPPTKAR